MKIGSIICEYNPFHNGHLYAINKIKSELKPDAVVCIMSGCFTQRGEPAVSDKYTRAKHAILAGADVVFELPAAFATAPAEIFAKGAVKLLSELKTEQNTLCFGMETPDKNALFKVAAALNAESREFKAVIRRELEKGCTLAHAKYEALKTTLNDEIAHELLKSPNNLLAVEYVRAILQGGNSLRIMPFEREGSAYLEKTLKKGKNPSATAIRELISQKNRKKTVNFVPPFVYEDLPILPPRADEMIMAALHIKEKSELKQILDCTEGLENRIKALLKDNFTKDDLFAKLCTRRYTGTRLSRITLSALLGIKKTDVLKFLKSKLYLKTLAVNTKKSDLLSELQGKTPFLVRKSDADRLQGAAADCFALDAFACDIYSCISGKRVNKYATLFITP